MTLSEAQTVCRYATGPFGPRLYAVLYVHKIDWDNYYVLLQADSYIDLSLHYDSPVSNIEWQITHKAQQPLGSLETRLYNSKRWKAVTLEQLYNYNKGDPRCAWKLQSNTP